jgi:hypothetical protein
MTTLTLLFPPQLENGQQRTVTIGYAGSDPNTSALNASAGTMPSTQWVVGQSVSVDYTPPATGDSVTFTDLESGATLVVPVVAPATIGQSLFVVLTLVPSAFDDECPIDPDEGFLTFSGNGSNGATVIRTDTNASVGPPVGTPLIHDAVGQYHYIIPLPATGLTLLGYCRGEFAGVTRVRHLYVSPSTSSLSPPGPLPPDQAAQIAALLTAISQLGAGQLRYSGPVDADGRTLRIVQGDDVTLQWTFTEYAGPSLAGATAVFGLMPLSDYDLDPAAPAILTVAGTVATTTASDSSTTVTYTVPLTAAQTNQLPPTPTDRPLNTVGQLVALTADGRRHTAVLAAVTVARRVV